MNDAPERRPDQKPIKCMLVVGGQYHDNDFARLEILQLLAEDERIRVRVFEDYEHIEAIKNTDVLISYTCNVIPSPEAQNEIQDFVKNGGHYFALHSTNSALEFLENGLVDAPENMSVMFDTLGTKFLTHPPIVPFTIRNAKPDHPLVKDIPETFVSGGEQYLVETRAELEVLLDTEYNGTDSLEGFVHDDMPKARHPVFYIRRMGEGAVLYLTMGHCRGHYDMEPVLDWWPEVDRTGWEQPLIYDLLRRGINWICQPTIAKF